MIRLPQYLLVQVWLSGTAVPFSPEFDHTSELGICDETIDIGYFSFAEIEAMDLMEYHRVRIQDVLVGQHAVFVR